MTHVEVEAALKLLGEDLVGKISHRIEKKEEKKDFVDDLGINFYEVNSNKLIAFLHFCSHLLI